MKISGLLLYICIRNQEPIPRTLFRNGKRSTSQTTTTDVQPEIDPTASNVSHPVSHTINTVLHPNHDITHSTINPPLTSDVSTYLVSRELNNLKDEIKSIKSDIATLTHRHECTGCSPSAMLGEERAAGHAYNYLDRGEF